MSEIANSSEGLVPIYNRRWFRRIAVGVVLLLGVMFSGVVSHHLYCAWLMEEETWFDPAPESYGNWEPENLDYEDVWFSCQGERLHGWLVEHEDPRAVVLFFHGSSGNLSYREDMLRRLHDELQCTAMVFDYRGFGRSEGKLSGEAALYEDCRAARHYLAGRLDIPESEIVLFGRSLGAALAIELAARDGTQAVVIQNAFSSLPDVAHHHFRFAPVYRTMQYRLNSIEKIGDYHGRLLQSHAGEDEVIPLEQALRLFGKANEPKTLLVEPNTTHTTPISKTFLQAIDTLIEELATEKVDAEKHYESDLPAT